MEKIIKTAFNFEAKKVQVIPELFKYTSQNHQNFLPRRTKLLEQSAQEIILWGSVTLSNKDSTTLLDLQF